MLNLIFLSKPYYRNNDRISFLFFSYCTGGKKRSMFYYDLWNIKYLSKFKWDDLTQEIGIDPSFLNML